MGKASSCALYKRVWVNGESLPPVTLEHGGLPLLAINRTVNVNEGVLSHGCSMASGKLIQAGSGNKISHQPTKCPLGERGFLG